MFLHSRTKPYAMLNVLPRNFQIFQIGNGSKITTKYFKIYLYFDVKTNHFKSHIQCNCIPNGGGCTWDQKGVECTKNPYEEPQDRFEVEVVTTTTAAPTTTPMTCSPLNEIYGVMPPVTLDCDKGAPVGGAKCLVKCKDGSSRSTHSEINCICNSKTCKWREWKQLKKNEIKCLNPSSGSKTESAGGDMCDPLPKERLQIKTFFNLEFSNNLNVVSHLLSSERFSRNIGLESIQTGSPVATSHSQEHVNSVVLVVKSHRFQNSGRVQRTIIS